MNFQYSAGAFVYTREKGETRFLVLKRHARGKKSANQYDLPKGHIEKGETAETAGLREIKEESGLDVYFLPFFKESTKYFFQEEGKQILKQVTFYIAEAKTTNVKISDEHSGYEWASCEEAAKKLKFKDLVKLLLKVNEYINRWELIKELNIEYGRLPQQTPGWGLSKNLVPGEGRLDAKVMLVGQAPGNNEEIQRRPFIGRSGKLLDSLLRKAGFARAKVYITSVVQFFPPENRLPTTAEVQLCKGFLFRQIEIIKPKAVVLLGNLASSTVVGIGEVEKNHGKVLEKEGTKYLITYHPAAALRFPELSKVMEQDLSKLKQLV